MRREWKRYPAYRDSGVEWLGEVPEHWELRPLGHSVRAVGGGTPSKDKSHYWKGLIPWVSPKDMKVLRIADSEDHISESAVAESAVSMIEPPAVLMVVRGMILAHTVPIGVTSVPVTINQDMKALLPIPKIEPTFLAYQLAGLNSAILGMVELAGHGTCCLRTERWRSLRIAAPPPSEQRIITAFLDRETARIDALIAKKEAQSALLQERHNSLVTKVVTKGIDYTVPMKASGVHWLGDVPRHWQVLRLKFLVREGVAGPYGSSLTKAMYTQSGIRVYGQQQVIPDNFAVGDYYISEEQFEVMRRYQVFPGDLLVSVMGTVGRAAVVPEGVEPGIINPRLVRYRPDTRKVTPRYLQRAILSDAGQIPLREAAKGTTMEGLNMAILGSLQLPVPPLDEQERICTEVERMARENNRIVLATAQSVRLLREHRQALITAAVTGQIDVRSEALASEPA